MQAKRWVFTINNYTSEVENRLKELDCEWIIFGHEKGENGTPHLQGAVIFSGKRRLTALGKLFPWHLEVMRGSPQDSKTYCTKEDPVHYFEKGIMPPGQEQRGGEAAKRKWEQAFELAKNGDFDEIPRDLWIRHMHSFKQIYADNKKDPSMEDCSDKDLKARFLWLCGPSGTGKSHTARRISKELGCEDPYMKDLNKWWNGYTHQKVTIIEEAAPKQCEYLASYFKKWADKWSFTGECKGTVIPSLRPEYIIVTSNYSIDTCFPEPADSEPLHRRFTEITLSSKNQHIYWPVGQMQLELQKSNEAESESNGLAGNSVPLDREAR